MANTLSVIDMVTREALRIAHENLTFIGTIDRSYDDSFAKTGAKIGDTLRVRMPNQYVRRTGSRIMDAQDQDENTQTVTVATQDGVDMRFNSAELTLSIDELSKRYIEPAVKVLVAGIEGDVLADLTKQVYHFTGTAGTVVGSSSGDISAITAARGKLNQQLAPKSDRSVQFDSITMGAIVNGNKTLFHDSGQVKSGFREGFYSRNAMADWYENEKTWAIPYGTDVSTVTLDTYTVVQGDSTITTTGATAVAVGNVFTIDGVYDCHPETKAAYSHLKQFVILAGSTDTAWIISPTIYLTGPRKNVASSTGGTAAPSTTATVNMAGTANAVHRQNLMYQKEAFTFVTADLPLMDDALKCVRRTQDGLSVRVWQGSDIRNDELLLRLDILYGWKALRPEWACRITN